MVLSQTDDKYLTLIMYHFFWMGCMKASGGIFQFHFAVSNFIQSSNHTLEFFFIYKCCIVYETGGRCTNSRWFNSSRDGNLSFSGNLLHEGAILTFVSFPPLICRKRTSLKLSINYFTNLLPEAGIQRAIYENGNMTDGSDWVNS